LQDYFHELICITEREKFVVPVHAIGSRAVLDFPDEVAFEEGPVKFASTKTLLVRNVGNRDAKFDLQIDEWVDLNNGIFDFMEIFLRPFTVSPQNGVLAVNESMQVVITFTPTVVGDHHGRMRVSYDTGEEVYISLHGVAQNALVRLDKNSIRIENTYISMANQRTVTITNRSNVIAHFRWTQYATPEEEEIQKSMSVSLFPIYVNKCQCNNVAQVLWHP
jgi:hydrocephalus-inducing protein